VQTSRRSFLALIPATLAATVAASPNSPQAAPDSGGLSHAQALRARNRYREIASRNLSHPEREVRDLAVFVSGTLGEWERA